MAAGKDVLDLLDSTISAIESDRDGRARQQAQAEQNLAQAWQDVLDAAAALRGKLRGKPQLRYFNIARDGSQIAISFHSQSPGASSLLMLFRAHPEGKFPTTKAIWCREPGQDDKRFQQADEAVRKMVRHCAANLTIPQ